MITTISRNSKPARRALVAAPVFVFLLLFSVRPMLAAANRVAIDCNAGESLAAAITDHPKASVFWISGTCHEERVVIERHQLTLRGLGPDATIAGGGLEIRSALGVVVRNLIVRDVAEDYAIEVTRGSEVQVIGVTAEGSVSGLVIEDSVAEVANSVFRNNQLDGLVNQGGRVFARGRIQAYDNSFIGIISTGGGVINSKDGTELDIEVSDNFLGFVVQFASSATLSDARLVARDNLAFGVLVAGEAIFGFGGELIIQNNGSFGMAVGDSAVWTQFVGVDATVLITGNAGGGVLAANEGNVTFSTLATVADNAGPGLFVDNSTLNLDNTTVRDNAAGDVLLSFGTSATFGEGNNLGVISCDDPVLIRGASCPTGGSSLTNIVEIPDALTIRRRER